MENEYVRISFQDIDDVHTDILHISLPSQPFKAGEEVTLSIENNKMPEKWDEEIKGFMQTYTIVKIESMVRLAYVSRIHQYVDFAITVKKVN